MAIAIDPVCGMEVDTTTSELSWEHDGTTYWFCGRGCMLDFQDDPAKYLDPERTPRPCRNAPASALPDSGAVQVAVDGLHSAYAGPRGLVLIAIALLVVELASTTFYAIFLAAGAAAAGVVAFVFPDSAPWVQAVVAMAVAMPAWCSSGRSSRADSGAMASRAHARASTAGSSGSARSPPTRSATSCIRVTSGSRARCGWPSRRTRRSRGAPP